jgi:hypothetical protein
LLKYNVVERGISKSLCHFGERQSRSTPKIIFA